MKHNRDSCKGSHLSKGSNIRSSQSEKKTSFETLQYECYLCPLASQSAARYPTELNWRRAKFHQGNGREISLWSVARTMQQTGAVIFIAMKSLLVVFVVMLLCAMSLSQIVTPCPKRCVCDEQYFPESRGVGARVNCSGRRLKKFPRPLPRVITTL